MIWLRHPHKFFGGILVQNTIKKILTACLVVTLAIGYAWAQTTAEWSTAADGNWADAINWSTSPFIPNNGQPATGDIYDVGIGAFGSVYEVTLDTDVALNQLDLDSFFATLKVTDTGSLEVSNGIHMAGGTLRAEGGLIRNTTITGFGSFLIDPGTNGVSLDNVTLAMDTTFDPLSGYRELQQCQSRLYGWRNPPLHE